MQSITEEKEFWETGWGALGLPTPPTKPAVSVSADVETEATEALAIYERTKVKLNVLAGEGPAGTVHTVSLDSDVTGVWSQEYKPVTRTKRVYAYYSSEDGGNRHDTSEEEVTELVYGSATYWDMKFCPKEVHEAWAELQASRPSMSRKDAKRLSLTNELEETRWYAEVFGVWVDHALDTLRKDPRKYRDLIEVLGFESSVVISEKEAHLRSLLEYLRN